MNKFSMHGVKCPVCDMALRLNNTLDNGERGFSCSSHFSCLTTTKLGGYVYLYTMNFDDNYFEAFCFSKGKNDEQVLSTINGVKIKKFHPIYPETLKEDVYNAYNKLRKLLNFR